jgi:hypothetical protein
MDDINIFRAIIGTIVRLHAPNFDHTQCMECEQDWPCKTVALVKSRPDSPYVEATESQTAMELGFVLSHIDKRFSDAGNGGDSLVDAIHQLVLIPELLISGTYFPEIEFCVSLRVGKRHTVLLWKLQITSRAVLQINASIDSEPGREFLSNILTESFTPIEASEVLDWWRKIPQSSRRAVTIELPKDPKQAIHILTQLTNASAQFAAEPISESFVNNSDIYN